MRWRTAIFKAAAITVAAFLIAFGAIAVQAALGFDGKCGGLMPFLAAAQPCTLGEYVWSSVSFSFVIFFFVYWYVALSFAAIVLAVTLIRERKSHD
jgi:hypothetical protein